jgi:2'-5' RNA ligase
MSTGIAIVWPAWFLGSTDPLLHVTALFLGDTETTKFSRDDIERVLRWEGAHPGACRVTGMALFGKEGNVPVLTIDSPALRIEQEWLTKELDMYGIVSPSEFPFNPHVTIAKEEAKPYFPHYVQLESPVLWWGSDRPIHSKHQKVQVPA